MKRAISLLLTLTLVVAILPTGTVRAASTEQFDFMNEVTYELPTVTPGQLINEGVTLPTLREDGFVVEPSAPLPQIREDGFLKEPSGPMPEIPARGKLMEEPGAPDPDATPISNAEELKQIQNGGNFVLTADIDLTGVEWEIKKINTALTLDGQGHIISNLTDTDGGDMGLIGQVNGNLTVRNLILQDFSFSGEVGNAVGALAGYVGSAYVENCSVEGLSTSNLTYKYNQIYYGGLIGGVSGGEAEFRACSVQAEMEIPTEEFFAYYMGGLVGRMYTWNAAITDCVTDVSMTLPEGFAADTPMQRISMGGLVGMIEYGSGGAYSFLRCHTDVEIEKGSNHTGGMIGYIDTSDGEILLKDCMVSGQLTHAPGMLVGAVKGGGMELDNCTADGSIVTQTTEDSEFNYVGMVGVCGEDAYDALPDVTFRHCLNAADYTLDGETYISGRYVYLAIGGLTGLARGPIYIFDSVNTGTLTAPGEIGMTVCGGLIGLAGTDILKANGTTVYPVTITRSANQSDISTCAQAVGGLVGMAQTATVMEISDSQNSGDISSTYESAGYYAYAGGLVGSGNAIFNNCANSGDILSDDYAAGLIGYRSIISRDNPYTISAYDCSNTGSVTALTSASIYGQTGGLSTQAMLRCENCYVNAPEIKGYRVYGLTGSVETIENCYVKTELTLLGGAAGGFAASADTVTNSYADVVIRQTVDKNASIGGLFSDGATIRNCAANVDITVPETVSETTSYTVGGLSAGASTITHSYATGRIDISSANPNDYYNYASYAGGLVGDGQVTIGHCWSDVDIRGGHYQGGLVGHVVDGSYLFGSYSDSDLHGFFMQESAWFYGQYAIGGLIGSGEGTVNLQDCTFTGTFSDIYASFLGGLVGGTNRRRNVKAFAANMTNCYYEGHLSSLLTGSTIGGLAGIGGDFTDCWFRGSISGSGGSSGGIAGTGGNFTNCQASGSVRNAYVGGIAGSGESFRDCVSDMTLGTCLQTEECTNHRVGGIAGSASGNIRDCTVRQSINLRQTVSVYAGGVAGYFSGETVSNTTTRGVSVRQSGQYHLYVGGILGECYGNVLNDEYVYISNCTVDGSVVGIGDYGTVRTGGIFGYGDTYVYCDGCAVNGSVTGSISQSVNARNGNVATGSVGGACDYVLSVNGFSCKGVVIYPVFEEDKDATYKKSWHENYYLGKGGVAGGTASTVTPATPPKENYTFLIKGIDISGVNLYPLGGVAVYIDDTYIGMSAPDGSLKFDSDTFRNTNLVSIVGQKDGYFDYTASTYFGLEDERMLILREKDVNKFYISSVEYIDEEGKHTDILSGYNTVDIPVTDRSSQKLKVEIDWNGATNDSQFVYLGDSEGNLKAQIMDGVIDSVFLTEKYELKEDVYLYAQAKFDGFSETVKEKKKLSIRVGLGDIKIPAPQGKANIGGDGDPEDDNFLYFLKGVNMGAGFGDLGPFAGSISVKNNYLKLTFGGMVDEKDEVPLFKKGSSTTVAGTLSISGYAGIAFTDPNATWEGGVIGKINDEFSASATDTASLKLNYQKPSNSILTVEYPFNIPVGAAVIPCSLTTKLGMGGHFNLGVKGPYDKAYVNGTLGVSGYGSIFAAAGRSFGDALEINFGVEAAMYAKADFGYDEMESTKEVDTDVSFDGVLNLRATFKAGDVNLTGKLRLGYYKWTNEDGATWSVLGWGSDQVRTLALESSEWTPMARAQQGAFLQNDMTLFGASAGGPSTVRYADIGEYSDAAVGCENGQPVLYFTADDGEGTDGAAADHTVLYRSVRDAEGEWSDPVVISGSGYPAIPAAAENVVVWVESSDTSGLEGLMNTTDIKVAVDGVLSATFPGNGYVYNPKISVSENRIVVGWLSDPNFSGQTTACYAVYDGTSWGGVQQVSTASNPTDVFPYAAGSTVYVKTSDNRLVLANGTITDAGAVGNADSIYACINEDGMLDLYVSNTKKASVQTDFAAVRNPIVTGSAQENVWYVVWQEADSIRYVVTADGGTSWSEPAMLCAATQTPGGLNAAYTADGLLVSYYQTQDGVTSLYTAQLVKDAADLVIANVEADMEGFLKTGVLKLKAEVFNNSPTAVNGCNVVITDENGARVYENSSESVVVDAVSTGYVYAEFAPDGVSGHTYCVMVLPVTQDEMDTADNSYTVELPGGQAALLDANFVADENGKVKIEAYARNEGGAPLENLTMKVTDPNGAVLTEASYADVYMGSVRAVHCTSVQPDVYYTVTIYEGETAVDHTMMMYEDPTAQSLEVVTLAASAAGQVELELEGRNLEGGAQLILALYKDGKMVTSATGSVAGLNGNQKVSMTLGKKPAAGRYEYRLFVLSDAQSLKPLMVPRTGYLSLD